MPYHLDFSKLTLSDLKAKLERADLIPSQLPLLDGIGGKMSALKKAGVSSLEDLSAALRGSRGPASLSSKSGVAEDYLVLLRRALEGFRPKPARLGEYPGVEPEVVEALAALGFRDSKGLYEAASDSASAAVLARKAAVPAKAVRELLCLCCLSRVQWVSPAFARTLYEAGYESAAALASARPEDVYESVLRANEGGRFYKGKVGLRDMGRLVALAGELTT
jgi:hypothetical protein